MGWVKVSKWSKYNMYQHNSQVENLRITPSQFSNGVPFENPKVFSSTSNMVFIREGIFDNKVIKNNNDDFVLTKLTTDMGFHSQMLPIFYLTYNARGGNANYTVNLNIDASQQIYMLKFYFTQSMSAFHTHISSANNKPPIELGMKVKGNGNTYVNLASRGQWDSFNAVPFYAGRFAQYGSELVTEVRHKIWEYKNLNGLPTQTLTIEAYPVSLPDNFSIVDQFFSYISCRIDIYTKGNHLLPSSNQIFIYEDK
jgi:hypothetical protein